MDRREYIDKYIRKKLEDFKDLGKNYDDKKINDLVDCLDKTNSSLEDLTIMIDTKFSYQLRKLNHNSYLSSLKKYYLSSVEKLKHGNNCYLLSYDKGNKILEQATITENKKIDNELTLVTINKKNPAYKKSITPSSDYELIISDMAYLLNVKYAKTYFAFNDEMNPIGVLNECFDSPTEKFLNLEDTLKFIKEESTKFTLKESLVAYHDRHMNKDYHNSIQGNIEYVFSMFEALPDIKKSNVEELKKDFLTMKIFEIIINSVDNNLKNIGLIINKKNLKYTYRLSPSYNKYTISKDNLSEDEIICNFMTTTKQELIEYILTNHYDYIKDITSIISCNVQTLSLLFKQIIEEHLSFEKANEYNELVDKNIKLIANTFEKYKKFDEKDEVLFSEQNDEYENRIAPFIDNYDIKDNKKGSASFVTIAIGILIGTILLIGIAIFVISKANL